MKTANENAADSYVNTTHTHAHILSVGMHVCVLVRILHKHILVDKFVSVYV